MNENAGLHGPASFNRIRKTGADRAVGYHEKEKEMGIINEIHQQTKNRFLNMYELVTTRKTGKTSKYFVASRAEKPEDLMCVTHVNKPDGVIIYAITEDRQKVLVIRQYRYPIDGFIYEFPAGLVDEGESYREAAVREVHEETGLTLTPIDVDPMFEAPRFTTVGMTDESCACVYGYISGETSKKYLEENEEIEALLIDRKEARRILKEETVAAQLAYHIECFMSEEDPFAYLFN